MVNWKAIGVGVIITLTLAYLGKYIPHLDTPIAPIIGGIIAGYMVGGSYKNGIIYGGLSAGLAGFVYTIIVIVLDSGIALAAAVSMNIAPMSLNGESGIITASIIILGALLSFVIYLIMGLIGGIIGIAIKERNAEKQILRS
jgi:hypothetical protein